MNDAALGVLTRSTGLVARVGNAAGGCHDGGDDEHDDVAPLANSGTTDTLRQDHKT